MIKIIINLHNMLTTDEEQELLKLVKENNIMLRQIIAYLNKQILGADGENFNDMIRNVLANLISNRLTFD